MPPAGCVLRLPPPRQHQPRSFSPSLSSSVSVSLSLYIYIYLSISLSYLKYRGGGYLSLQLAVNSANLRRDSINPDRQYLCRKYLNYYPPVCNATQICTFLFLSTLIIIGNFCFSFWIFKMDSDCISISKLYYFKCFVPNY